MITYPISSALIALPSWAYYAIFVAASLVTFLTLRGRRLSLAICSAIIFFGAAYGIGNIFFHVENGSVPHLALMIQPPYTSALWIIASAAALIAAILAYFWKGFGLFFSAVLFGFIIGLLVTNRLVVSILLGFFVAFFQLLSPHLIWLLSSTLAGSLWAGEAMGLILHNSRFYNTLLWSAGFLVVGVLFQWAINRDLFKRQALTQDPEENQNDLQPSVMKDAPVGPNVSGNIPSSSNTEPYSPLDESAVPPPTPYPALSPEEGDGKTDSSFHPWEDPGSYNALQTQNTEDMYSSLQPSPGQPPYDTLQKNEK